jgi:hypothetical protein
MLTASKIGRRMRHLRRIADFHPRRTLTRCAGLEANRRPIRDRNFSCGKTRFFRGGDMAAAKNATVTRSRKNFHRFATRR